ncbi:di-heme-cytochrome C peroxidase [Marinimicrobium alkaliphilum]|uniref:di-heme-cytochrome C peroxidase n=1 Tax=Marinimicrobium alkaliphilum TaxID=2202654 RepID=UPI000DBAC5F3|nr:di-heme-cytochrome C peroxidase [Marinimicrobium alkaliphilum]
MHFPLTRLGFAALKRHRHWLVIIPLALVALMFVALAIGKLYQSWDRDPERGAIGVENGGYGESFPTPVYLDQGWSANDSLWFYNTTQGSGLLPYDFFIALEQADNETLFRSDANIDRYRYLPQKPTFFNPDGLPVGFVKDTHRGRDYMGFTCAACHTGQINYQGQAIRIDGAPAMADMDAFLHGLERAMKTTLTESDKRARFIDAVLARRNDYRHADDVIEDLEYWSQHIALYNTINHSNVNYGHGRLDAFGRIYNRVLQHVLNTDQLRSVLLSVLSPVGEPILSEAQVDNVLAGIDGSTIIRDREFLTIHDRLLSSAPGYPNLNQRDMLRIRNALFNTPNAPVAYPVLWDITHTDYVQWNGLAGNANMGALGRNTGEVLGVFAQLDFEPRPPGFSLSGRASGQRKQQDRIAFTSSVKLTNLERLEAHLRKLTSPQWPEDILGPIDRDKAARGARLYAQHCQSCHELIERDAWDRLVISKMTALEHIGTDPAAAENSVRHTGKSGNFKYTYQRTSAGVVVMEENAPVVQILTAVTSGVVATPEADKNFIRRRLDWLYTLALSLFENEVKPSVKAGHYNPDTSAEPYASLLAYKARPLNGTWAAAPYLHNGSVPTLYDLLLPERRDGDPDNGKYRPDEFMVGSREFDPVRVGFRTEGYDGTLRRTHQRGNWNSGHDYGAVPTTTPDGRTLAPLTEQQRWELVEFLKTL